MELELYDTSEDTAMLRSSIRSSSWESCYNAIYRCNLQTSHVRIDVNDNKNSTKSDNYMYILTYVVMLIMLIVAQKGKWKYIITNDNCYIIIFEMLYLNKDIDSIVSAVRAQNSAVNCWFKLLV